MILTGFSTLFLLKIWLITEVMTCSGVEGCLLPPPVSPLLTSAALPLVPCASFGGASSATLC